MDYDADGIPDFISGSYDPGDVYLFRGLGGGKYAAVEQILDKSGQPLVHHPQELAKYTKLMDAADADEDEVLRARVASFGSWPAPIDWEGDGDLDLLIGSFRGELFLRVNEGTRSKPVYGNESIPVEADGQPITVYAHANPVVADWNSDGLWDLVISSGDGSVGWHANVGSATEPKFGPRQPLVAAAAESKFLEQNLKPGAAPVPGVRAQICVTDYNGDGRLDLIVGDYSDLNWMKELSSDEQAELQELVARQAAVVQAIGEIRTVLGAASTDESTRQKQEREIRALGDQYDTFDEQKKRYFQESRRASFVWLYLRNQSANLDGPDPLATEATGELEAKVGAEARHPGSEVKDSARSGPVSVTAHIGPSASEAEGRFQLSVQVEIEPGWHVYAATPEGSSSPALEINLNLPDGVRALGQWRRPEGQPYVKDLTMKIYADTVAFTRDLEAALGDRGQLVGIETRYQVCNDQLCLPPTKLTTAVPLKESSVVTSTGNADAGPDDEQSSDAADKPDVERMR